MAEKSSNFSAAAQGRFDSFVANQNAFFQELNTLRQHWADSMEAQLTANTELMNQLSSTRSLPELVNACQECTAKRGSKMAEDGKLLLADYQRCLAAAAKCFFGGLTPPASS